MVASIATINSTSTLVFLQHKCWGLLDPGGLLPFLSLFLFFSHLPFFPLKLLAYPEYSALYPWQPRLVSVCLYSPVWSVWHSQPYNLTAGPDMDSHDVISGRCGGKSQPVRPVVLGSRLFYFNYLLQHPLFAPSSPHFGLTPFCRKLIARLKLHGFSLLNHYNPKKYLLSA